MLYVLHVSGDRTPLTDPTASLSHVCKGVATPDMWWNLSGSGKKNKTKKDEGNCKEARAAKAKKHRDANRHDATLVMKKAPSSFEMSDEFNLSLFGEDDE